MLVRAYALAAMKAKEPVQAWIVDDTGFPKKGKLSVGVARLSPQILLRRHKYVACEIRTIIDCWMGSGGSRIANGCSLSSTARK